MAVPEPMGGFRAYANVNADAPLPAASPLENFHEFQHVADSTLPLPRPFFPLLYDWCTEFFYTQLPWSAAYHAVPQASFRASAPIQLAVVYDPAEDGVLQEPAHADDGALCYTESASNGGSAIETDALHGYTHTVDGALYAPANDARGAQNTSVMAMNTSIVAADRAHIEGDLHAPVDAAYDVVSNLFAASLTGVLPNDMNASVAAADSVHVEVEHAPIDADFDAASDLSIESLTMIVPDADLAAKAAYTCNLLPLVADGYEANFVDQVAFTQPSPMDDLMLSFDVAHPTALMPHQGATHVNDATLDRAFILPPDFPFIPWIPSSLPSFLLNHLPLQAYPFHSLEGGKRSIQVREMEAKPMVKMKRMMQRTTLMKTVNKRIKTKTEINIFYAMKHMLDPGKLHEFN